VDDLTLDCFGYSEEWFKLTRITNTSEVGIKNFQEIGFVCLFRAERENLLVFTLRMLRNLF